MRADDAAAISEFCIRSWNILGRPALSLPGYRHLPQQPVNGAGRHAPDARPRSFDDRVALEATWLRLTRVELPALAGSRRWPVSADHCFQRILLDHAVGGRWYDHVTGRPAYRHLPDDALTRAVALGRAAAAGEADLHALNAQSLAWRGKGRG